jgi:tetraacyldisaccharide 4'-kinase
VSRVFGLLVRARAKLYDSGVLPTRRLNYPVISVGNLTVGGTGKTPLVIALAEAMRDRGFRPVVLSRGYGRTTRGIVIVDSRWEECGDEPMLIKRRLVDVPVVVGADRYQAGFVAEQNHLGDVFILDDGFQHRQLHRDVDIVTIDPVEWAAGEMLLPAGRWREPKSEIARAHVACVQESDDAATPSLPIPVFIVSRQLDGIYQEDSRISPENLMGRPVIAFAGIAKPERFFATIESLGIQALEYIRFSDHHHYSSRQIEKLPGGLLITTEKDAVRIGASAARPYCYLRISAKIPDVERLMSLILNRIK